MTSSTTSASPQDKRPGPALNPKVAVPILLFVFVFSLVIDNGFKTMTMPIAQALDLSVKTASLQASLAGVIIGIGAVVYAALADSISIRKLMLTGVVLIAVGSILAFAFSSFWPMVLTGRLIQTGGLSAAETLYVIYVTKHLSEADQKTYLGFSTAAFQAGLLIGALTSGFISTYVSWTAMFLIPLILILTIPPIIKLVPEDEAVEGHLDVLGLFFIAVFATDLIHAGVRLGISHRGCPRRGGLCLPHRPRQISRGHPGVFHQRPLRVDHPHGLLRLFHPDGLHLLAAFCGA